MLKIERDKVYLNGRGEKIRVVCVDNTAILHFPVIGVCEESGDILTFTAEGHRWLDGYSGFDLVREVKVKEKEVAYLNIYPEIIAFRLYGSKQMADAYASSSRTACIRVEYEEGQFDD